VPGAPGAPATEPRFRLRKTLIGVSVLLVLTLPLLYSAIIVPLSPWEQVEVSLALMGFAMLASHSRALRPLIIFLSCFASMRYFYWRVTSTLEMDRVQDGVVSLLLLGAESYGLLILFLGYFQTIELKKRSPAPLGREPTVDVFIPTYNESVEIVGRTAIGALSIEYANKRVFILDDGKRPEIARMAAELGCEYLTRPDNKGAKAGNLNHALGKTDGELVAIFDADHVPVRGFLKKTVGFFEDGKVALVQAAQHFFNPDPYERNLKLTGRIAPEQTFFYHVIQPGNDFWNSAFFCGSCAVLRRSAIRAIGGFRTDTVTEDAHTALELHSRGYESVYLGLPLAAGLATESFAAHVMQRMRWARGMAQILRLDPPLLKRGLSLPQRLNYLNAMLHFFFGLPRLIMILAPLSYLLAGIHPIRADVFAVFAYILPHIGLSTLGNSILSQSYRHSFWAGVYEVSIAPYTAGVTSLALVSPRLGKFDVTAKGTSLDEARFDARTSWGTLVLLALSATALAVALPWRLLGYDPASGDPNVLHAILINGTWALANVATLIAAACVAYEQPQQRAAPRVLRDFPCELRAPGLSWRGRLVDVSEAGARVHFDSPAVAPERCELLISSDLGLAARVSGERRWSDWGQGGGMEVAYRFLDPDPATRRRLIELIFTGDDGWLRRTYPMDDLFLSFSYLVSTYWRVTEPRRSRTRRAPRISGDWACFVGASPGRCRSVSPFGARIQLEGPAPADAPFTFSIPLASGERVTAVGRPVAVPGRGQLALEFDWPSDGDREGFARGLYLALAVPRTPAARRPWALRA
jgi:cellulose synthase (UDP-forming)